VNYFLVLAEVELEVAELLVGDTPDEVDDITGLEVKVASEATGLEVDAVGFNEAAELEV